VITTSPGYIASVARLCAERVRSLPAEQRIEGATVLFSAHGVPQSYIAAGDPYQKQIQECTALITQKTRELLAADVSADGSCYDPSKLAFQLSYQSRVGPVEWLRPYTDDVISELGAGGCKSLVVVPVSFVSEHIETLEEIDIEYRELAESSGIEHWRRVSYYTLLCF
jgi:protoporphyrin/coproporphyrin ferrochelatase